MAALDLSGITRFPAHRKETLSGTNGNLRRVVLPVGVRCRISLYPETTAARLICDDAVVEDAAVTTADYPPLPQNAWSELLVGKAGQGVSAQAAIGLVSSTNSQVVYLLIEEVAPDA